MTDTPAPKQHPMKGRKLSPEAAAKARANLTQMGKGKPLGAKAKPKDSVTLGLIKAYHAKGGAKWLEGLDDATFKTMLAKLVERGENIEEERRRHEQWLTYLEEPVA